jgi:hypothetical protein
LKIEFLERLDLKRINVKEYFLNVAKNLLEKKLNILDKDSNIKKLYPKKCFYF